MENNAIREMNRDFTIENTKGIFVPKMVEDDLCSIIEERLKSAGLYYRISYRVKSTTSILAKLKNKDYGKTGSEYENKKMQDLIGIRIILYYDDDVSIVLKLLNSLFSEPGEWDRTEKTNYEFRAMKINGTFKLPIYLSNMIVNPNLDKYIDDTFEIQIRTNAFEGWHEIEHDIHYKGSALNEENEALSRQMNSILATLELCDHSMVRLLEDLGHQHYINGNWEDMIRCHFRIKCTTQKLEPALVDYFDSNKDAAKQIFKFPRQRLISYFWRNENANDHSVNAIVKAINDTALKDDNIFEIFASLAKGKSEVKRKKKFEPFRPLGKFCVFASSVVINTDINSLEDKQIAFDKAVSYIYSWIKSRLQYVFPNLPDSVASYDNELPGYRIKLEYDRDNLIFKETTTHPDTSVISRLWISTATIKENGDRLELNVSNQFAEPIESYRDPENGIFLRPNFYGEIADNIGIVDVERLRESSKEIADFKELEELYDLIYSGRRYFPVIVFMVSDKTWADVFDIEYFAYLVGYYAHIRVIRREEIQAKFAKEYNLDPEKYLDSITVIYSGEAAQTFYKEDIQESSFEVIKYETKKYWNEKGCKAFRRQLIADIREKMVENIETDMYSSNLVRKNAKEVEKWDICDDEGKLLGTTIERADAKNLKKGQYHKVVSLYSITKDKKVLITRRSVSKSHPHRWEVTCGSILSGENVEEGAIRELKEETGIDIRRESLKPLYVHRDDRRHCIYYGFMTKLESSDIEVTLCPEETDRYQYMPLEDFYRFIKTEFFTRSESSRFKIYENKIKTLVSQELS